MRIIHRISVNVSPEMVREFLALGLEVREGLVSFDIDESDGRWPDISELANRHRAADVPRTTFTNTELEQAPAAKLGATWHHGYPEPSDDFGYLDLTYDLSDYCDSCGIGLVQKAPFRMVGEPRWGRKKILQLNWVFDEFFVKPDLWEISLRPVGVNATPVLDAHSDKLLSTVVQLHLPVGASAILDGYPKTTCIVCKRQKYEPIARGLFPPVEIDSSASLVKTEQYFGSGSSAARSVIVSNALMKVLSDAEAGGADFMPVAGVIQR